MAFDPTKFGATPVQEESTNLLNRSGLPGHSSSSSFDPSAFGAVPVQETPTPSPRFQFSNNGLGGNKPRMTPVTRFLTSSQQGVAESIASTKQTFNREQAGQAGDNADALIKAALQRPRGDPQRTAMLQKAHAMTTEATGQASERQSQIPSNKKTLTDVGFTTLDLLGGGTYGKAALGLKTGALGRATPSVVEAGKNVAQRLGERTSKKNLDKIAEAIAPKLSAKEAAEEAARLGVQKKGLLGRITLNTNPRVVEIAETIKKYVPGFNPKATLGENLNKVKSSLAYEATKLRAEVVKSGQNKLYSFKELSSKMSAVAKPIVIKSDAVLNRQFDLAREAALKIAKSKGGTIEHLLDARQAFDELVEKQFPNLYDNASKPMRQAITAMRETMNTFIADNLKDVAYKQSMKAQTNMFRAIDNLSEKLASGELKEIGTNALRRFGQRHPVLTRAAEWGVAGAAGGLGIRSLGE